MSRDAHLCYEVLMRFRTMILEVPGFIDLFHHQRDPAFPIPACMAFFGVVDVQGNGQLGEVSFVTCQ